MTASNMPLERAGEAPLGHQREEANMDKAWSAEWLRRISAADPASLMDLYGDDASFEDITLGRRVSGRTDLGTFSAHS